MGRRSRRNSWWPPYVPVAERRAQAAKEVEKLRKKGVPIEPIEIEGRKIATTFWGKAWCEHIESFSDYENRLPRGRRYARNGSVCHLEINEGEIKALVAGSELYNVKINVEKLETKKWQAIKSTCAGKIGSLIDFLSGKLNEGVMSVVCHRSNGLFPLSGDIKLSCDCPDWATMCKHVAAVLYGVGARLDHDPAKLFLLRGVKHEELVDMPAAIAAVTKKSSKQERHLDETELSGLFNIDIATDQVENTNQQPDSSLIRTPIKKQKMINSSKAKQKNGCKSEGRTKSGAPFPKYITGSSLRKKRLALGLSQAVFASKIGVSAATISRWEGKGRRKINLTKSAMVALRKIWRFA